MTSHSVARFVAWTGLNYGIIQHMKIANTMIGAVSIAAAALAGCSLTGGGDEISAVSPDGRNKIRLYLRPMAYEVLRDGKVVVGRSRISLRIEGKRLAREAEGVSPVVSSGRVMGRLAPAVYKKGKVLESGYETMVDFGRWGVRLMARDDGVAYRFETRFDGKVRIAGERAGFTIPDRSATCWVHFTDRPGCEETKCQTLPAEYVRTDSSKRRMIYSPFVYRTGGATVAVLDSDVFDYPVRNFDEDESASGAAAFKSVFAGWPKRTYHEADGSVCVGSGGRHVRVEKHSDWLVETDGTRTLPWRAFALADRPAKLVESDIVYALARPAAADADFSWVKPGKVAWDWWNAFDNKGDPEGCTTETYLRFIDFAADNGVEYVIMDEGWSEKLDIWKFSPRVDVPRVIEHADRRGVGIILWMAWAQIVGDEDRVAAHFAKLGAKGFKVDFIDRGDAEAERFLWKFAESCARNRMLVDYHGAHRPTGLSRAYPNVLNYEGVHGLEQMKWSDGSPEILENDVKLCFTRMTAGPMDYTPGAMDNYAIGGYPKKTKKSAAGGKDIFTNPGSLGTRSRQMAMIALFEAPLQMLCDSPTKYERSRECFSFMVATPTTWDDTVGLDGDPDSFVVVARRKGSVWYVAGITNDKSRVYQLDTSFLGGGDWKMETFRDSRMNRDDPQAYSHETIHVRAGEKMAFRMAPGGGFVARFSPRNQQ